MMKYRRIYFTGLLAILTLIMISPVDVVAQNRADVIQLGSEFMVVDDNKVRIYYQTGAQNGSDISTAGRADVQTLGSNFIVVDDNGIRIIYQTGEQKGGVISMDVSSGSSAVDLSEIDLSHNGEIDIWDVAVIAEYFGQMVQ